MPCPNGEDQCHYGGTAVKEVGRKFVVEPHGCLEGYFCFRCQWSAVSGLNGVADRYFKAQAFILRSNAKMYAIGGNQNSVQRQTLHIRSECCIGDATKVTKKVLANVSIC